MIGLGGSVPGNITGSVIVVRDFNELDARKSEVPGKIVLFNEKWITYGDSVAYRVNGPSKAAAYGALACLIRSVTPYSLESPHTGMTEYDETITKIPAAAISIEDADMF